MRIRTLTQVIPVALVSLGAFSLANASDKAAQTVAKTVGEPLSTSNLLQVMFGLIIVLAIIVAGAFLLRRFGSFTTSANGALKVLAGLSIGPRERIVLLQAGEKQLVVGIAPGRIQTLCELDEPVEVTGTNDMSRTPFANKLNTMLKKYKA
jgi:flagellar protein FliO/FliZ